jgi:hypothetical protein
MFIKYFDKNYEMVFHKSNNRYETPFHNDLFMMKIMIKCLENTEYFIETGLFFGYTSYFVAKNFSNINCYSCEINPDYFNIAKNNIGKLNNLIIELNKSPDALYNLNKYYNDLIFNKNVLFWLDAHWFSNPLNDEIDYITKNFKKFTIFIDDFVIPYDNAFTNDGFTLESIIPNINNKEKIKIYMPSYDTKHIDCNNCNNNSSPPVGYCIITTENIETYGFLKEITIV